MFDHLLKLNSPPASLSFFLHLTPIPPTIHSFDQLWFIINNESIHRWSARTARVHTHTHMTQTSDSDGQEIQWEENH